VVLAVATGSTRGYANLTGSTFEGNDGNLAVITAGNHDWVNAPNLTQATDTPSGQQDSSFSNGAKEDFTSPGVGDGSIPPNKNDLIKFYTANELASGANFLYVAFTRSATNGNADIDFEINHQFTPSNATTGDPIVPLNRTDGDALFQFTYPGGGGAPGLEIWRWAATASSTFLTAAGCLNSSSFPATGCWSSPTQATAAQFEGASNSVAITNPLDSGNPLAVGTFGEAAINLKTSGIFPSGTCTHFGAAWAKSRSADSGTSDLKDLIAPQPVNISNCGEIKIIKHTDPAGINQNFSFTSSMADTPDKGCSSTDTTPSSFTLNDSGVTGTNTEDCQAVPVGSYTVTEGAEPANFALESLSCTVKGSGTGVQHAAGSPQADITLGALDVVTCTYVNKQLLGAILITKTSSKGLHPGLAGATFSITGPNNYSSNQTSGADGTVCVDHLPFGTYTVTETKAPTGYSIDDTSGHSVPVNTNSACGDGHEAPFGATDTPLTNLVVTATGQAAPAGTTKSQITCTDAGSSNIGNSPTANTDPATMTANGLKPGTYTCTVVIDP
jgi:Prealbumin-like fold domain